MAAMAAGATLGLNSTRLLRTRRSIARVAATATLATPARCGTVPTITWRVVAAQQQQTRWKGSFAPRVGKAVEPSIEWEETEDTQKGEKKPEHVAGKDKEPADKSSNTNKPPPQTRSIVKLEEDQDQNIGQGPSKEELRKHNLHPQAGSGKGDEGGDKDKGSSRAAAAAADDGATLNQKTRQVKEDAKQSGPLEAVLQMETPQQVARQHPSMSPPPYVHHFDSYSLVKQLHDGGYSTAQAIEAMKGIRALLAQHLDVAQESLVSKSDVENETYLFRAACSELGQEIKNNRRLQDEQVRQQRTLLQHEVDILTQSLNQEALSLNDNVRGMFNDRRMTVREEQKNADSAVQQINYKISTSLVSDSKSEIEAVRWVLIRRSALGIFFMAMLTLATVRYATYVSKKRQAELSRERELEERVRRDGGKRDNSSAADAAVILAAN